MGGRGPGVGVEAGVRVRRGGRIRGSRLRNILIGTCLAVGTIAGGRAGSREVLGEGEGAEEMTEAGGVEGEVLAVDRLDLRKSSWIRRCKSGPSLLLCIMRKS